MNLHWRINLDVLLVLLLGAVDELVDRAGLLRISSAFLFLVNLKFSQS